MLLQPGTTLGPYAVTAKIGEGRMGEVYRARDIKLDRDVALKVLPQAFADDPDRLARFEREAKVLASLNHPNIGGIHGLEESEGVRALVLEYIDGPTLADRIKQGPIPVDEALPIAKQIAEALEAAQLAAGSYYWGGAAGTWFWIDPESDLTFVGMIQHQSRPTVREVRGLSRNFVYQAVVGP